MRVRAGEEGWGDSKGVKKKRRGDRESEAV